MKVQNMIFDMMYVCVGLTVDSMIDRDDLINTIALYYTVVRCKAQVDQLTEGLRVLGVLELMKENPYKAKDLLVYKEPEHLTADKIISMFTPETEECLITVSLGMWHEH